MKRALFIYRIIVAVLLIALGCYLATSHDHMGLRAAFFGTSTETPDTAIRTSIQLERLRLGATFGRKKAQFKLARLYASGKLGFTDMTRAAHWMEAAADQDYGTAQLYMARFAFMGQGEPKDLKQGAEWVKKAAKNNVPNANGLMGTLYLGGIGVNQDFDQALVWLKKASTPEAMQAAENIQKSLAAIKTLPAAEQAPAMTALLGRTKLDISHSFVQTLEALRKAQETAPDMDESETNPTNKK